MYFPSQLSSPSQQQFSHYRTNRIHRNRSQVSGVTRRELAEGGEGIDEDELAIIEGCLELEEEMGLMEERASST
ncbi:LOW QUALITY PROTEIN: uncharacterized protein EMH_0002240 [Eimeria mitis]|uniref:Uncharacterized protein n=1 Tax=Eimeria mitis TaxID=44415 RepID=U6JVL7_9EIME|nr:LOW QUALITY PROTEIN: uncharacterized protein EMH_0002240 [Eimeria mitis]CDJ28816.1 hypothetical protein EMH_0002240 [Eimeria mitis]